MVVAVDGLMADVSVGGALFKAGLHMVENVKAGDYILLHAGFAIQKLSEEAAGETLRIIDEMNNALNDSQ